MQPIEPMSETKNVLIIVGSPRKHGNTARLAAAFAEGAESAGKSVKTLFVSDKKIAPCKGCEYCHGTNECVVKDDMQEVYSLLVEADTVVFSTPIYFFGISAQLKSLVDRLHNPVRKTFGTKKLVLLAVCASSKDFNFDATVTTYENALAYFSLEDGGRVLVKGVREAGAIEGNAALIKARELGKRI